MDPPERYQTAERAQTLASRSVSSRCCVLCNLATLRQTTLDQHCRPEAGQERANTHREQCPSHFRNFVLIGIEPAVWPKDVYVIAEDLLVKVDNPGVDPDDCAAWDRKAVYYSSLGWDHAFEHQPSVRVDTE